MKCPECGTPTTSKTLDILGEKHVFEVAGCQCEALALKAKEETDRRLSSYRGAGIPAKFIEASLEKWEHRPATEKLYKTVLDYANHLSENVKAGRGMVLTASVGVGKTHLVCALGKLMCDKHIDLHFVSAPDMFQEFRPDGSEFYRKRIFESKALIIDDVGVEKTSEFTLENWWNIVNHRYSFNLVTIITTNLGYEDCVAKMGERAVDRLRENALVASSKAESYRNIIAKRQKG